MKRDAGRSKKEGIKPFAKPLYSIGAVPPAEIRPATNGIESPKDNRKGAWLRCLFFCPFLLSLKILTGCKKNSSIQLNVPTIEIISSAYCAGMMETHQYPDICFRTDTNYEKEGETCL